MTPSLADIVRTADPATLQRYAAGLDDDDLAMLEQTIADLKDPDGRRVYRQLGYEPVCIPRVKVALALGYANPIEAEDAGAVLPAMCGECPAERFDDATEFDVFFGGAAGGSKTTSMIFLAIRLCARWAGFRVLFLRETFDELDENVFPELRKIDYADAIGGHWNAGRKQLDFPNGSTIRFRYLGDIGDISLRRGGSYNMLCVERSTPIAMADGSFKPISEIQPGEFVETLEGPCRVNRSWSAGRKSSARLTNAFGSVVGSVNHQVYAAGDRWLSPIEMMSTESLRSDTSAGSWAHLLRTERQPRPWRSRDSLQEDEACPELVAVAVHQASAALAVDHRSGCRGSENGLPEVVPPQRWFVRLALHGPVAYRSAQEFLPMSPEHGAGHALADWASAQDSLPGCRIESRSDDGLFRQEARDGRVGTPSRVGAAASNPRESMDDRARTPIRSPKDQSEYCHPYTKALRHLSVALVDADTEMVLVGEQDLWDIEVEGANHYVAQGGIVLRNCFDERNQLPPGAADGLRDRLRSAGEAPVIGVRSTGNPGGRSHSELKRDYVTATDHGARIAEVVNPDTGARFERRFIPAKATDNPYLGDHYFLIVLGGIADPMLRRAMADGDWDVFAGMYFPDFDYNRHVVPRGVVELDRGWPRYEGIDYGRAAPFCMLRAAIDGEARCWLYREIYEVGLDEAVQAKMIREDEEAMGDRGAFRAADPSMWGKIGAALPFAETYRREGVTLTKADNDRVPGWSRVHSYLAEVEPCGYHAGLGWQTCPKLHIVEGTCPNFERTLPDMIFDPHKVEDAWSGGDDHAPDAFRYLVSNSRLTRGPARISVPGPQHVR